jgi:hypothetical protein
MDPLPCPCGHAMLAHDYDGCPGERLRACACRRTRRGGSGRPAPDPDPGSRGLRNPLTAETVFG